MDEPFGSLDALTREHLQEMVHKICADKNLTVLFVTHSVDEAIYLSDRIVVMGTPGRVVGEFNVDLKRPRHDYDWRSDARVHADPGRRLGAAPHRARHRRGDASNGVSADADPADA